MSNFKQVVLGGGFMLVNKHGDVILHAPATTRRMAWKYARAQYGAHACLVFKRRGYRPHFVNIHCNEEEFKRWV